jgi:SAM-dependent methyltransferase
VSDYEAIARYYDDDHAGFEDDIPFFRELARRADGPVLEAMCGTGRVTIPLARDGLRITGIDNSPAMLQIARARATAAGVPQLELLEADLRTFEARRRYGLAFVALNSFMHMTTVEDQLAALGRLHAALRPGSLLALDLLAPDLRTLAERDGVLMFDRSFRLANGSLVQKYVVQRADPAAQINRVTFQYDEIDTAGGVRRSITEFRMRWIYRYELEHLLARTGFTLEAAYGSYELEPYGPQGEQLLAVARRS